jgi:hypothetical protein
MTCPECGQQMWNYETGQMRCANDHVFAITALEGVQAHVIRVDRPSPQERFQDFALGTLCGALIVEFAQILVDYL